ncbi:putative phosphoglycerate mutase [Kribbella steppae]|uniref:Putative phosphoglycerate mutase n=1 Tax=Kribbella steppae TaxID=2512223 RepID=A0A4R2HJ51_9ACTN|nr:histidine phosphatase family protein [Kribbella steppae]TCO30018.1 putative phosphoglycerate mutase [Kribbella steppae]
MTAFEVVYLARHGQTEWNVEGRKQGRLDSPLTPQGLAQVRRNAALVSEEPVDGIFTSPLGRAHTTAEVFATALRLPLHVLDDLSEVDHGEWSGLTKAEVEAGWPGELAVRKQGKYGYRFPGGESYADADVRAGRALAEVAQSGARRPLLVSHEMIGRMLLKQLGVEDALSLDQPSEVVYRVTIGDQSIVVGRI